MQPVYQTDFSDSGNCLQAATASILGLPLDDVPHFAAHPVDPNWLKNWISWIAERGFQVLEGTPAWTIDGYYIAFGKTTGGYRHAVVMKGGQLAHDPGGENCRGLAGVEQLYLMLPHDPAI